MERETNNYEVKKNVELPAYKAVEEIIEKPVGIGNPEVIKEEVQTEIEWIDIEVPKKVTKYANKVVQIVYGVSLV